MELMNIMKELKTRGIKNAAFKGKELVYSTFTVDENLKEVLNKILFNSNSFMDLLNSNLNSIIIEGKKGYIGIFKKEDYIILTLFNDKSQIETIEKIIG